VTRGGGILVVDDDPDLREFLGLTLASMGFEVISAANGQEALDVVTRHTPDLILLDMKMPVMNGWEFCRALEGRDACPPIVVLTAAPDPAARAAEVHAQGWLGKPFEYADLETIVRRFTPARSAR
jgi:two-component system, chemotaxis family, chemotaxis protein CheY